MNSMCASLFRASTKRGGLFGQGYEGYGTNPESARAILKRALKADGLDARGCSCRIVIAGTGFRNRKTLIDIEGDCPIVPTLSGSPTNTRIPLYRASIMTGSDEFEAYGDSRQAAEEILLACLMAYENRHDRHNSPNNYYLSSHLYELEFGCYGIVAGGAYRSRKRCSNDGIVKEEFIEDVGVQYATVSSLVKKYNIPLPRWERRHQPRV